MRNGGSIVASKATRSAGPVHRPSDAAGPSTPHPQASVGTSEDPGQQGEHPVELPVEENSVYTHKPPPYSSPSNASFNHRPRSQLPGGSQYYPGLPILDYRQYLPPLFELSEDATTITSKASYLSENVNALATLLRNLATVPPKPQVLIKGNRGRKVDFNLKLNLMNLLVPSDPRDRLDYLRCVSQAEMALRGGSQPSLKPDFGSEGGLESWCETFIKDPASVKTFTMQRVVANLDTNWIEGQIRSLVAGTNYKGQVTVQFPVTHSKVVIQNPDKHNKFFTSVTALFVGKNKYETVKVVWPFATGRNDEPGRRCVVQSERTWWEEWKDPIKYAIATKRQGWVTNEDKLECIMEGKAKGVSSIDWGSEFE